VCKRSVYVDRNLMDSQGIESININPLNHQSLFANVFTVTLPSANALTGRV
jgi:hypothetical protein